MNSVCFIIIELLLYSFFLLAHVQMYKRQNNVCEWDTDFSNGGKPESNTEKLMFSQFYAN